MSSILYILESEPHHGLTPVASGQCKLRLSEILLGLVPHVAFDHLFVQTNGTCEISNRPDSSATRVSFLEKRELVFHRFAGVLFDDTDHLCDAKLRWKADDKMDVVGLDISLNVFHFGIVSAHFVHLDHEVVLDSFGEHGIAVAWYPDDMVFTPVHGMCLSSNVHGTILPCPDQGGFRNPIHPRADARGSVQVK